LQINGVITLSVPMDKEAAVLKERIVYYAKRYKQLEGKEDQQIASEMAELDHLPFESLTHFEHLINQTRDQLARITSPVHVLYGEMDDPSYKTSAEKIFESVTSDQKTIKGFTHSKHLMTLGKDMNEINQDILTFLNELKW
ncbi:MAG: carboxylesterase, partial [Exiguobacterium undae]